MPKKNKKIKKPCAPVRTGRLLLSTKLALPMAMLTKAKPIKMFLHVSKTIKSNFHSKYFPSLGMLAQFIIYTVIAKNKKPVAIACPMQVKREE